MRAADYVVTTSDKGKEGNMRKLLIVTAAAAGILVSTVAVNAATPAGTYSHSKGSYALCVTNNVVDSGATQLVQISLGGLPRQPQGLMSPRGWSACSYGTLAIFGKLAYGRGIALPTLLSYRFALAALVFWVLVALRSPALPPRRRWLPLVVMGAAGYVGQSASYFGALRLIPASTTSLLLYTFPAVVTLLAALLFHESLSTGKLIALAVALIGT